ncbi:hypothetical protein DFH09DRAFT_1328705 [Mycena vulgaris]|nr:hypothetical protein DFH09DRAFT_1328705 [Mycena vulgaris]
MQTARYILGALFLVANFVEVHGLAHRTMLRRQDVITFAHDETFTIDPSPTFTDAAVSSAYSAYSQKCGADLDTRVSDDYTDWLVFGGDPNIAVTAAQYTEALATIDLGWLDALTTCSVASSALVAATQSAAAATPTFTGSFTGIPAGLCQAIDGSGGDSLLPGCATSTDPTTGTVTSGPSPTSQAAGNPVKSGGESGANPGQSSGGGGGTQTQTSAPQSSKPGGAAAHRPVWIVGMVTTAVLQAVLWN